jgi:hypothetical protein
MSYISACRVVGAIFAAGFLTLGCVTHTSTARAQASSYCLSSQLRLSVGQQVPERTQQNALLLRLKNVSRAGCALRGYPGVALSGSNGVPLRFTYRRGGDQMLTSAPPTRVWLRPGAAAYLGINKQTCIARQTVLARRIRVIPPGDRRPVAAVLSGYPELGYCGPGDPGHVIDVSPVEATMQAVYADRA